MKIKRRSKARKLRKSSAPPPPLPRDPAIYTQAEYTAAVVAAANAARESGHLDGAAAAELEHLQRRREQTLRTFIDAVRCAAIPVDMSLAAAYRDPLNGGRMECLVFPFGHLRDVADAAHAILVASAPRDTQLDAAIRRPANVAHFAGGGGGS